MTNFELNDRERALASELLGYLNFSSGNRDARFAKAWDKLFEAAAERGIVDVWKDVWPVLRAELDRLAARVDAFRDSRQARAVFELVEKTLDEYRIFHRDSLFGLKNDYLYNSFFVARVCRIATELVATGFRGDAPLEAVRRLNDFLGFRPIPVLEGEEKYEPNEREWVSLVPLYLEGVGVAFGKYRRVVEIALQILRETDDDLTRDATFDLANLEELGLDPRAFDFDHPVNRRPNYNFGTWDDRRIDQKGYFRRFVVHRSTLDAIMSRIWEFEETEEKAAKSGKRGGGSGTADGGRSADFASRKASLEYQAAAVLAGTALMASGVSGGRVDAHDSTVSLATLTPKIAAYRDAFYERLIEKAPEEFRAELKKEAARLYQPFGGARQALNQALAKKRADQLQRFNLARTYARMGYFEESKRQAEIVETASARLLARIDALITRAHLEADAGKIALAAEKMPEIEELVRRGLACGAFPDPWFILGFGAQYGYFRSIENVTRDHRIDGFIDLLNDIFDLYGRLQKEAAAAGDAELRAELSDRMGDLAGWWDRYGSENSSDVEGFSGQAVWESAAKVSTALAAWSAAGRTVGDVAFWRRHVERFKSPKAFVLLGEALLDKNDFVSSASLLTYWLDQSDSIPLIEGDYSFHSIALGWIERLWDASAPSDSGKGGETSGSNGLNGSASGSGKNASGDAPLTREEYLRRWNLTKRFLDGLEANAGKYWDVPRLELDPSRFDKKLTFKTDNPVLADLTRRLLLSTKYLGESKNGVPRVAVDPTFKDAVRFADRSALPSAEEFERFYRDNASYFPPYMTSRVFLGLLLTNMRVPTDEKRAFQEKVFGKTISVSNPNFGGEKKNSDDAKESSGANAKGERRDSSLLNDILRAFESKSDEEIAAAIERWLGDEGDEEDGKGSGSRLGFGEGVDFEIDEEASELGVEGDGAFGEDGSESDSEEENSRGFDPLYRAAYDNMTFRDSADDGVDGETLGGGKGDKFDDDSEDSEFARETERVDERLTFIYSTAKLWKYAVCKSPLLRAVSQDVSVDDESRALDDETLADARMRLEGWREQAARFEAELYELIDQIFRFRVPKPVGTADGLVEYDELRGTKETALERVVWTIVEVEDALTFLKAALRDEETGKFEKPWKARTAEVMSAIFRVDVKRVRRLWDGLIAGFETETLLYIPTTRGGDAKAIVDCRRLQQAILRLLEYAPRLGLFDETFRLLVCVQKMEQARLSAAGSITEFDKIVETATRGMTETLAESAKGWRIGADDPRFESTDDALVFYLEKTMDAVLSRWLSHSQRIRVASIETASAPGQWDAMENFVKEYGADLFTQHFLAYRNIRAILHQKTSVFLTTQMEMYRENRELEFGEKLTERLVEGTESFERAAGILETILECVAENYSEYADYNSTTTQSDRGEKLYMFLDMLRVLANYERIAWNLKPVYWVHDALIRAGLRKAAALWKRDVELKTAGLSQESLRRYRRLNERYGIRLQSVYERIQERFVQPLEIAQMRGLVFDAISEARRGDENNPVFRELEKRVESFAERRMGVGFEVPEWLEALQDEVVEARVDAKEEYRKKDSKSNDAYFAPPIFPIRKTSRVEVERQLKRVFETLGEDDEDDDRD